MNLEPILTELAQQTPSRDVIIDELDILTDFLRGGYPTGSIADPLFDLFYRLITFSQWHIQQYALSCTKYIFLNSGFPRPIKLEILQRHLSFTAHIGVLLSDIKREVREMAAQCLQHLAIEVGDAILSTEFNLTQPIFSPPLTAIGLEGQQMALGRLATAFRIVAPDSLSRLIPPLLDSSTFDTITNPSDNGYIFWYSTRSLNLLFSSTLDLTLSPHLAAFSASHHSAISQFHSQVLPVALARLRNPHLATRRAASTLVTEFFNAIVTDQPGFITSLLPTPDDRWLAIEGRLCALASCVRSLPEPLPPSYVSTLASTLFELSRDPIPADPAPVNQKGAANGMAGRALVQLLRRHSPSLYDDYIEKTVAYLLDAPVAAHIDAGLSCLADLIEIGGFDVRLLRLRAFKNKFHASFPIRDLAKRTVLPETAEDPELIGILIGYATSPDADVRESVCRALQAVHNKEAVEVAVQLASDPVEAVRIAALDLYGSILDEQTAPEVPGIIQPLLAGDGEDVSAALRLARGAATAYRDSVTGGLGELTPVVGFHALAACSPAVQGLAQELLVVLAGNGVEVNESALEEFYGVDADDAEPGDYAEMTGDAVTILHAVVTKFSEALGFTGEDIAESAQGDDIVSKLARDLVSENPSADIMQRVADVYADENIESEGKRVLLLALDVLRRKVPVLQIPDPTPVSTTHLQEGFAKGQAK
jgi:hypothetical protein